MPTSALLAGIYGSVHDQISFSVSPDYFTYFKFIQFDTPWAYQSPRQGAAYIGFVATWWLGVMLSVILGLFGFQFASPAQMVVYLPRAVALVFMVTILAGLVGLAYGYWRIDEFSVRSHMEWVWPGVADPVQFTRVGVMHEASYLGGGLGLLAGIIYLLVLRYRIAAPAGRVT